MKNYFIAICAVICLWFAAVSFSSSWVDHELPIVAVHGIMSEAAATHPMKDRFEKVGIKFYPVEIGNRGLEPIPVQAKKVFEVICKVVKQTGKKVNIVCHSQGNIVARYAIEHFQDPEHPLVHNVVGLAGPNAGIYDLPSNLDEWLEHFLNDPTISWYRRALRRAILGWAHHGLNVSLEKAHKLFYTSLMQDNLSFTNYFKDPLHYDQYLKYCKVLPYLNNEKTHKLAQKYKANVLAINDWVLVQSKGQEGALFDADSRDSIITPHTSSHFGFFKIGSHRDEDILGVWDQYDKAADSLGLALKFEQKKLHFLHTPKPIAHTSFWSDLDTFNMIVPFLVYDQEQFNRVFVPEGDQLVDVINEHM